MSSVQKFINLPKADRLNILGIGMRYASFVNWAGFEIPGFPENVHTAPELLSNVVDDFVRPSSSTTKEIRGLLSLSFQDVIEDNVSLLYGSIDFSMMMQLNERVNFDKITAHMHEKYRGCFKFLPEIFFATSGYQKPIKEKMKTYLETGFFKSVACYPKELFDTKSYKNIFREAEKMGIRRRALVNERCSPREIIEIIENYHLDEIMGGAHLSEDCDTLKYLAKNSVIVNLAPARDIFFRIYPSYKEFPIRKFLDAGVKVSIGTNSLLVYQKNISEQCAALYNEGVLSEDEIKALLSQSLTL